MINRSPMKGVDSMCGGIPNHSRFGAGEEDEFRMDELSVVEREQVEDVDPFDEYGKDLGDLDQLMQALLGDEGPVPAEDDTLPAGAVLKPGQTLIDYKIELEVRAFAEWSESVDVLNTANIRATIELAEAGLFPWKALYDHADQALVIVAMTGQADHGPTDEDYARAQAAM